jgi:hypothetical protein
VSLGLEIAAAVTRPALAATMEALPGIHPLLPYWPIVAARDSVLAPLGTVDFPWLVLGPLGYVFSKQLDELLGGISTDPLGAVTKAVTGVAADVGNILSGAIGAAGAVTMSAATYGFTLGAGLVKPMIAGVESAITGGLGTVGTVVSAAFTAGTNVVKGAVGLLGGDVRWAAATLGGLLAAPVASLAGIVGDAIAQAGGAIGAGLTWAGQQILSIPGLLIGGLVSVGAWVIGQTAPLIVEALVWVKENVVDPIAKTAGDAAQWALDNLAAVGQGDPEAVVGVAAALVAAAIPFGVAAHALGNAAEIAHPLKAMGFTMTARALVDLTDIGAISAATIGVGYALALGRPMEYWASRRIRWHIPDPRDLLLSYTKGDISEGEVDLALAYHGFNDARIQALKESAWREPRPFELRRLMDSGIASEAWLKSKLRRNQLRPDDVDVMAQAMIATQYSTQRSALWSAAFSLLRDGASTPEGFAGNLAPLGMNDAQISLGVRAAALQHAADLVTFNITTLLTAVVDGQMTMDDFGLALVALGLVPDRVDAEQARAQVRITGKVAASVTGPGTAALRTLQRDQTSLWIQRFRRGLVDAAGLYTNLVAIGLEPAIATTTVDIEQARMTPLLPVKADTSAADTLAAAVKELQKAYTDEFRAGLIDAAALSSNLLALGLDPTLVAAIVIDEQARAYVPPQTTPSPADEAEARKVLAAQSLLLRDEFRAGFVDQAAYLTGLTDAGMDPLLAQITVEREVLRAGIAAAG